MARDISQLPADLKRKADSIERSMARSYRDATRKAANAAKLVQEQRIAADSGGDSRLSGVNKRRGRAGGAKVGARVRMLREGAGGATAAVLASGPLQLIANPTKAHKIASAFRSSGSRQPVINIPGVGYRRSAQHPGTRGRDTWRKARDGALDDAGRAVGREIDDAFRKGARG